MLRALPALCGLLDDKNPSVRRHAVRALGDMGPHARAALPVLREARKSGDASFRRVVDQAIEQINRAVARP